MQTTTMLVFAATVFPLVCSPGPDILFVASQGLSGGSAAVLRANLGIMAGYMVHAMLGAMGVATMIAASSLLFDALRWFGVAYLVYLALRMLQSARQPGGIMLQAGTARSLLLKGFLTSLLNPKGMLVYLAILPNFIQQDGHVAQQALILSAIFIVSCMVVYSLIGCSLAAMGSKGGVSERRRRALEGGAGGLLMLAAARMALH